jgi:hypothetical protein
MYDAYITARSAIVLVGLLLNNRVLRLMVYFFFCRRICRNGIGELWRIVRYRTCPLEYIFRHLVRFFLQVRYGFRVLGEVGLEKCLESVDTA